MGIQFGEPIWLLLLLVLVPLVIWMGTRLTLLTRFRRILIVSTRVVVILLLVLTLAQIHFIRKSNVLDVYFVMDDSESVPEEQKQAALDYVRSRLDKMGRSDRAGIAVFGGDALIEEIPTRQLQIQKLLSEPNREATNIGEAIRLAMAAFSDENKKRIVLVSDGNENVGTSIEAAESARGHRIPIDVVPLRYAYENDVIVESIVLDSNVHIDEPFDVKVFVRTDKQADANLNISLDGNLISTEKVELEPGRKNAFVLTGEVNDPGFHTWSVSVDTQGDTNLANNIGYAFTYAGGPPRILFVQGESNPEAEHPLIPYLESEKISVSLIESQDFPESVGPLQAFDSVVLANVGASELGQQKMRAVEQAVHELGVGLVMIGGDNSFGAGGYQDSPVERALPVQMDVSHKKVIPRGALVVILHTCEIPQGNTWARRIAEEALNVMASKDLMGVLIYGQVPGGGAGPGNWGDQWLYTLQEVGNKTKMRSLIRQCMPMDMPSMASTLDMAYRALDACTASVKHIVMITDGDPAPPTQSFLTKMKNSRISVSTVGISPHNPTDVNVLRWIADQCNGNFHNVNNPNRLPRIFMKEATLVRKPLLFEEPFFPKQAGYSPILSGLYGSAYPQLLGYVATTPKQLADIPIVTHNDDPLLAHWQYGVGKTAVFTSDAQTRWAADWLGWQNFRKFWSQLIRWTLRGQLSPNLQMHTEIDEEGVGHVVVDAVDPEGNFINFLDFQGGVVTPDLERAPLAFKQTGPGRYEATFPVGETGSYMVSARTGAGDEGGELITGGLAIPYSPEYREAKSNESLLRRIASVSGGRFIEPDTADAVDVFDAEGLPSGTSPEPLWPKTLALAILLVPLDVFFRRVMIDWRDVKRGWDTASGWVAVQAARLRPRRKEQREEAMGALFQAKQRATGQKPKEAGPVGPSEQFLESIQRAEQEQGEGVLEEAAEAEKPRKTVVVRKSEKEELRRGPKPAAQSAESFTGRLLDAKKRAKRK